MAVTEVRIIDWSGGATGKDNLSAKPHYHLTYQATCSSTSDGPQKVLKYFRDNVVWYGDPYECGNDKDTAARCNSILPKLIPKSGGKFTVDVDYQSPDEEGGGGASSGVSVSGEPAGNPLLWHDEIEIGYTQVSAPVEKAIYHGGFTGRAAGIVRPGQLVPVTNSAFVPFDPGLEQEEGIKIYRFTRNKAAQMDSFEDDYLYHINSNIQVVQKTAYKFRTTWQKYTAKIANYQSRFMLLNGFPYWQESVEVHVNPRTWRPEVCDRGLERRFMISDPTGEVDENGNTVRVQPSDITPPKPQVRRIVDSEGYPITAPLLFNGDGRPKGPSEPPVYITYGHYPEVSFAPLRF